MDSGNSGSLQSSSGGDEEYDSRPPTFFNPNNFGNLSNHLSLFPNQDHTFFDPNSQNFFHPNLNSTLLNLDVPGSRPLRPDLDYTKSSGSSLPNAQLGPTQGGPIPSIHLRSNGGRSASPLDQAPATGKNPKKRTRASRRAPTTVLTTDTSNFRAMVQEFTGIPAPPFSGSPYTRRFDLFGSGLRSDPVGGGSSLYPLRPSAQKVHQQSPFLFSSSSNSPSSSSSTSSSLMNINTISTNTSTLIPVTTSNFNSSSINYQLLPPSEPQNLLNLQNQMLSFQSLLPSSSSFNAPHGLNNSKSQLPFEEMGMGLNPNLNSHGNINQSLDNCSNNKLNSSSSDFHHHHHHHQKGLENVPPRGEGTVDSWICPSD